jgi:two-component system LytT family response regulator
VAAAELITKHVPNLVFLDVQMPLVDGFEVIRHIGLDAMPPVVFVTAYDEYAVRAFEVHALDYLLKPFTEQRFVSTLEHATAIQPAKRAIALQETLAELPRPRYRERIMVRHKDNVLVLKVADVDWIEAANNYVKLYLGKSTYLLREGISSLEAQLDPARFLRIHRSTIVNIDRIRSMKPWFSGDYLIYLENGQQLRLSRTHREKLAQAMAAGAAGSRAANG